MRTVVFKQFGVFVKPPEMMKGDQTDHQIHFRQRRQMICKALHASE